MAISPMSVVSSTSSALMPSTPRKYAAPIDGIHVGALGELPGRARGSYRNHNGTDTAKPRCRRGSRSSGSPPRTARNQEQQQRTHERGEQDDRQQVAAQEHHLRCPPRLDRGDPCRRGRELWRLRYPSSPASQEIQRQQGKETGEHQQRIVLHQPRLQTSHEKAIRPAPRPTPTTSPSHQVLVGHVRQPPSDLRHRADTIDDSVHDPPIDFPQLPRRRRVARTIVARYSSSM